MTFQPYSAEKLQNGLSGILEKHSLTGRPCRGRLRWTCCVTLVYDANTL